MKKYGDVVIIVRNGVSLNALVAQSQVQPDGEHLTVFYLDPAFDSPIIGGSGLQRAVATAFAVPFKEGALNGWKEVEVLPETAIEEMQANATDAQAKDDAEWEAKVTDLHQQVLNLEHLLSLPKIMRFGLGEVAVTSGKSNDQPAVTIAPAEGKEGAPVVLEFHNAEGAKVLADDVIALYPGGGPTPIPPPPPPTV